METRYMSLNRDVPYNAWHKVRLGIIVRSKLSNSSTSNREFARDLGCSEGTIRNILLYAKAAELRPDLGEDRIAAMKIRDIRALLRSVT